MAHTLTLNNLHIQMLESILATPEWAKDVKTLFTAGQLLEILESARGEIPAEANDEWGKKQQTIEVTEAQRETLKSCLKTAIEGGRIIPNPMHGPLLNELGLIEGD